MLNAIEWLLHRTLYFAAHYFGHGKQKAIQVEFKEFHGP